MRHPIDPKIDCVFKALLGSEDNRALLIHFLNALLGAELPAPVSAVEILNPYNEREFLDDKLSIVDVKARDAQGRLYQVEIQILPHPDLPARMPTPGPTFTASNCTAARTMASYGPPMASGSSVKTCCGTNPPMPIATGCATNAAGPGSNTAGSASSS